MDWWVAGDECVLGEAALELLVIPSLLFYLRKKNLGSNVCVCMCTPYMHTRNLHTKNEQAVIMICNQRLNDNEKFSICVRVCGGGGGGGGGKWSPLVSIRFSN